LCDCGKITLAKTTRLIKRQTKSCGCLRYKKGRHFTRSVPVVFQKTFDKIGLKINRLTIVDFKKEISKPISVMLKCECGNVIIKPMKAFLRGRIKSCGCLSQEISRHAKIKKEIPKPIKIYTYNPITNLSGRKYKNITVLYWCGVKVTNAGGKLPLWFCRCDCGKEMVRTTTSIMRNGDICGCTLKESRRKRVMVLNKRLQDKRINLISDPIYINETSSHNNRRSLKTIRNRVFLKYGDACVRCRQKNNKKEPLCIHHLKMYWSHPRLRYLIVNNIPLCRKCHDELHRRLGSFNPLLKEQLAFIQTLT
jgi:hypothetical protein